MNTPVPQEAAHTPAPWLVASETTVYALNEQGYNRFSAQVQAGHVQPMERTTAKELAANARLIAASPRMLDALRQAVCALAHACECNGNAYKADYEVVSKAIHMAVHGSAEA